MKRALVLAVLGVVFGTSAVAADGKAVFEAARCAGCHKPDAEGVGPSLTAMAAAYGEEKARLVAFLAGAEEPRMDSGKFSIMKPNLRRTMALSDDERGALADFILSHD